MVNMAGSWYIDTGYNWFPRYTFITYFIFAFFYSSDRVWPILRMGPN